MLLGAICAVAVTLERVALSFVPFLISQVKMSSCGGRLSELLKKGIDVELSSSLSTVIAVLTVSTGYILSSYALLFGQIRLYLLLFMVLGYFLAMKFACKYLEIAFKATSSFFIFIYLKTVLLFKKTLIMLCKSLKFKRKGEKSIDIKPEIL